MQGTLKEISMPQEVAEEIKKLAKKKLSIMEDERTKLWKKHKEGEGYQGIFSDISALTEVIHWIRIFFDVDLDSVIPFQELKECPKCHGVGTSRELCRKCSGEDTADLKDLKKKR